MLPCTWDVVIDIYLLFHVVAIVALPCVLKVNFRGDFILFR